MLIRLTKNLNIRISRPIRLEVESKPQLELQFQNLDPVNVPAPPEGYFLRVYTPEDESQIVSLFNSAEFPFNADRLESALSLCLPNGCYLIEHIFTKSIVATMMARHLATEDYPFGGRIDWLATDPNHRNLGLGNICASAATKHLLDRGYENIWVTTDDERIGAIKIFLSIGFEPVMNNATKFRWNKVIKRIS